MKSSAVVTMARNGGVLRQTGCVAAAALPGGTTAPALLGADVVVVSPDGRNVYAGAFGEAAVSASARDPSTGALTPSGCTQVEQTRLQPLPNTPESPITERG